MSRAAALLLCLLVGSLNLTASLFERPERRAENSDVISIDLGTTYSRVAVYRNGRVEIVPDEQGNRATPSQVAVTDGGNWLDGETAKDQHTANTIYGAAKRLLGRRFSGADVHREIELLSYAVVDEEGRPHVRVQTGDGGDDIVLSPEEIVADVLAKLKGTAEAFIGRNFTKAVISVPAYYSDAQRQATRAAGFIAGLEVLRLINDSAAAAIAYGLLDRRYDRKILVFDLGGGTFDATVILCEDGFFDVLSNSGDSHLGGQDMDQRVTDHFVEVIKRKHGRDITDDSRTLNRLRRECERAKRVLSDQPQARIEIEALFDGVHFSELLTRAQFEELNEDLLLKTMAQLEKAVADAGLDKREIDEIILVGGSTRIPKVQQLVRAYFDGKEPLSGINPDEAMAYGAAVHGSYLATPDVEEPLMFPSWYGYDVLSFGIETDDGKMTRLIPRNPTVPMKKTHVLTTFWDKRSTVTIKVFEGERSETKHCKFLGQVELSGIPPASIWNWGRRDIEVTLELDADAQLHAEATDRSSGKSERTIIYNKHRKSLEEIFREAEEWQARDELAAYVRGVTDAVDGRMEPEEEEKVEEAVTKAMEWFDVNPAVAIARKEDYAENLRELVKVCDPVVLAVHQRFLGGRDDAEL